MYNNAYSSDDAAYEEFAKKKSEEIKLENASESCDDVIELLSVREYEPDIAPITGELYETGIL